MATAMHALPPDHTVSSIDVSDANTLLTTYQDYPPTQPFIHDTYRRQDKPVKAYPESNRQGQCCKGSIVTYIVSAWVSLTSYPLYLYSNYISSSG